MVSYIKYYLIFQYYTTIILKDQISEYKHTPEDDQRFIIQKFKSGHSCFAFTMVIKPNFLHLKDKILKKLCVVVMLLQRQ